MIKKKETNMSNKLDKKVKKLCKRYRKGKIGAFEVIRLINVLEKKNKKL